MKKNKLPKDVAMMVEKGNLVNAIKTLSTDNNISMDEAKGLIDDYEAQMKVSQQQQQEKIVQKQIKQSKKGGEAVQTSLDKQGFDGLNTKLDKHLSEIGFKKPLLPYWWKRVAVIVLILLLLLLVVFFV